MSLLLRLGNQALMTSCGGIGMFFFFESFRVGIVALHALLFLSIAITLHCCGRR